MNKDNNYQNKKLEDFNEEDSKKVKFVLHNCYKDVKNEGRNFHSEVCPYAFSSYFKYPFFTTDSVNNNVVYEAYYMWTHGEQRRPKGPEKDKMKYILVQKDKDINDIKRSHIGKRRQSQDRGLFFSKDVLKNKKRGSLEFESLDLSADVITSIKSPLNKLLATFDLGKVSDEELTQMQLRNIEQYTVKCLFDKLNKWTDDKNLLVELKQSIKNFCYSVGTIGNMMPIPEKSNPASRDGGGENYWSKIMSYKNIFDNKYSPKVKNKNRKKFLEDAGYKFNTDNYKLFINAFCLQDYFTDNKYDVLINPIGCCSKYWFPFFKNAIDNINDWKNWFNCNTCLILKRGARIYTEGCGEKDNEKKNKARKELAWKLISDEIFNLGEWYKTNGIRLGLEPLS